MGKVILVPNSSYLFSAGTPSNLHNLIDEGMIPK